MRLLWFSWKDSEHPQAGGAETVKSQVCRRLVSDGHDVLQITGGYRGATQRTSLDGSTVIRLGGRYSVYWHAYRYYRANLRGWADLVIDECNTIPFFARSYVDEPTSVVIYQLAREVWFYQMPPPLSLIGYILEPLYMRLLRSSKVLTISESTKLELVALGFSPKAIHVMRMGSELSGLPTAPEIRPGLSPTLLYLGSLREMKRPGHVVDAFIIAAKSVPQLKLVIAGGGDPRYIAKLRRIVESSGLADRITLTGYVTKEEKLQLMLRADLIAVTSVKEGWGLIVTEAAGQGTPAVVYDVDGLRDSVRHRETGLVTAVTPEALASGIVEMLANPSLYAYCQRRAWEWSKELNFNNTYRDFCQALEVTCPPSH